jgi:hypothetical protein
MAEPVYQSLSAFSGHFCVLVHCHKGNTFFEAIRSASATFLMSQYVNAREKIVLLDPETGC